MKRIPTFAALLAVGAFIAAVAVGLVWARGPADEIELPLVSQRDNDDPVDSSGITPCQGGACLGLAGAVLRPVTNTVGWSVVDDSGCIYASSGDGETMWSAPIHLEQNATVNRLTMYAKDTNALEDCKAWFTVYNHSGGIEKEWTVQSTGSRGWGAHVSDVTEGSSHTVDHASYHYLIHWQPNELGSDMQVCGFVIDYQSPELGEGSSDSGADTESEGGSPVIGPDLLSCMSRSIPEDLPAVVPLSSSRQWRARGIRRLCLYGFPVGERIDVALATMNAEYAAHGAFRMYRGSAPQLKPPVGLEQGGVIAAPTAVPANETLGPKEIPSVTQGTQEPVVKPFRPDEDLRVVQLEPEVADRAGARLLDAGIVNGVTVLSVPLWWPVNLPSGVWLVAAVAPGFEDTRAVYLEPFSGISTRPGVETDPFINHHCDSYAYEPGETMIVEGAGLDADADLVLALYRAAERRYVLAGSLEVSTDSEGDFARDYRIPASYEDGKHYIVPVSEIGHRHDPELGWFELPRPCFSVSRP